MEADPKVVEKINNMSQEAMASLRRFAPVGHPYFDMTKPYHKIFEERFAELGGMTPKISKSIGWLVNKEIACPKRTPQKKK